jgi:putative membrane protein insertion efficiency factor
MPEVDQENYATSLKNSESEMKVMLSFSYMFYKEFISSQDVDVCMFQPSCSNYTMEAIEKKGALLGLLEGIDRLLRCYPLINEKEYPYNKVTHKYYDPH